MKSCTETCQGQSAEVAELPVAMTLSFRSASGQRGERTFEGTVRGVRCTACNNVEYDGPDLALFERLVALELVQLGISTGIEACFVRKKAGIPRNDLAALLGVAPDVVAAWEKGERQPSTSELAMILQLARAELEKDEGTARLLAPAPSPRDLLERVREPTGAGTIRVGPTSVLAA